MVQWLGFCSFTAESLVQSLGQGTKIPQAAQCGQKQTIRRSLFIAHPVAIPSSKENDILLKNLPVFHTQFQGSTKWSEDNPIVFACDWFRNDQVIHFGPPR